MQDKREIGYCVDRLEKTQYLKRVISNYNYQRVKTCNLKKEDRIREPKSEGVPQSYSTGQRLR